MRSLLLASFALVLTSTLGCRPPLPEGRIACDVDADCPRSFVCRADARCWRSPSDGDSGGGMCPAGHLCAEVSGEASGIRLLSVALYPAGFDPEDPNRPSPVVRYLPVMDPVLPARVDVDLAAPIAGAIPSTQYVVGIVGFVSSEEVSPIPDLDVWWLSPSARFVASGATIDLGAVSLVPVPRVDLPGTPGDDRSGRVVCPGVTSNECSACCRRINAQSSCEAASEAECTGPHGATFRSCDGPEDCGGAEECCGAPGEAHRCVASGTCNPRHLACHQADDCPSAGGCLLGSSDEIARCDEDDPSTQGDDRAGMRVCGTTSCALASTYCCTGGGLYCLAVGQTCTGAGLSLVCDGPEDCASGRVCCMGGSGQATCTSSACAYPFCHTNVDCPVGKACSASVSFGGAACQ